MEEEGIGMVLARATEIRLKISKCVHSTTTATASNTSSAAKNNPLSKNQNGFVESDGGNDGSRSSVAEVGEAEEEEEAERLLNICDAFESLETQLFSLQALQQQQRYEKEAALSEIEHSRKILIDKLKEYKGEHLEVINEASAFSRETVEHNHDLMLPPYPSRPPHSLHLDNGFIPNLLLTRKSVHNGVISSYPTNEAKKDPSESNIQTKSKNKGNGIGPFISATTKMFFTLVGVVSVLSLSGFAPNFTKRGNPLKVMCLFQQQEKEQKRSNTRCPPGKILVVEDQEARCIVKERIEVPFSTAVARPDVNYGCG